MMNEGLGFIHHVESAADWIRDVERSLGFTVYGK